MKLILASDLHKGYSKNTHKIHRKYFMKMQEEIIKEDVKAILLAGDLCSNKQSNLKSLFSLMREYISIPIIICRGNHDFWDYKGIYNYNIMMERQEKLFKEYNIIHVDNQVVIHDVLICGFDGWYGKVNVETNDRKFMPRVIKDTDPFVYLSNKAHNDLDRLLAQDMSQYRKKVIMTHFPPFVENYLYADYCANFNYMEPICNKFDVLCVGHSHRYNDFMEGNCRVLNCGSDYDKPQYIVFEV